MDSFFSLFDPSDSSQGKQTKAKHRPEQKQDQDTVKKRVEGTAKGRRRGRKSQGKSETLPEECSFLCEPEISTELLVKNSSYIENFLEAHDEDPNSDKRPKRRNSGRRGRRKKRISPATDLTPASGWNENDNQLETSWNNKSHIPKNCDESIGKNVNDLSNDTSKQGETDKRDKNREAFNIIEKLEKVRVHNDVYLAGDFNTDDLEIDSDDQLSYDDSDSDMDSVCEYGRLPPEPRLGNVEYKLQLVNPSESRFQHLVTQLKWRLVSGGGSAVYVVGVRDCGALVGLSARALRGSLRTVRRMAANLAATVSHVTARRLAPHRAVAEIYIRKLADNQQSEELRVAVMGANEAGKSTLVGVLTQGELDNGRGSARLNMFRHLHEVKSGRTSSLSHEILGFDAQGNVVNYGCSELMTAERIGERSAKLISFLDLAGHSKYQRTTLHGLTGYSPHCAMLVISATAGLTRITEEHIGLLSALELPFFAVVTKCDLLAARTVLHRLGQAIATCYKKPILITDENHAISCAKDQKLKLDTLDCDDDDKKIDVEPVQEIIPVFPVSCVRGFGLSALHAFLLHLQPPTPRRRETDSVEFQIDEIFHVGDSAGPVVGGLLTKGQLCEGDSVIIGPLNTGEFVEISVQTIYRNRVPCGVVRAGQSASLGLSHYPPNIRAGMVLLSIPDTDKSSIRPKFGGCAPGKCKKEFITPSQTNLSAKNRKNVRRKNKNLLQDIATVENCLTKEKDDIDNSNLYRSDSDGEKSKHKNIIDKNRNSVSKTVINSDDSDKNSDGVGVVSDDDKVSDDLVMKGDEECKCCDGVLLEDPNDPRGCMFFQASVQVLRHSTVIVPGFQCTVHVGNVRQTAVIEGIMSRNSGLRAGQAASVVFQFARCPEYLARGRRLLLTAGLGTRAVGRITQIFPHVP